MGKCVNHPIKQAVAKCRKCLVPLCMECRRAMPDGATYCSDVCYVAFKEFQQQVDVGGGRRSRPRISILGTIKSLIISAVLVAVIYGVLVFWLKTTDPSEMLVELRKIWRVLF